MKLKYLLILGLIGIMLNACKKETIIEEEAKPNPSPREPGSQKLPWVICAEKSHAHE